MDYSARSAIVAAAGTLRPDEPCDEDAFLRRVNRACHSDPETPPVDLLIRTSGEQRLSDFLLFESAYAELLFIETLWPDFDGEDLGRAVEAFRRRGRRYGGLTGRHTLELRVKTPIVRMDTPAFALASLAGPSRLP